MCHCDMNKTFKFKENSFECIESKMKKIKRRKNKTTKFVIPELLLPSHMYFLIDIDRCWSSTKKKEFNLTHTIKTTKKNKVEENFILKL